MTKFLQKFLLITLLFAGALSMSLKAGEKFDETEIMKKLPIIAGTTSAGREYWFSIPPCYEDENSDKSFFRIYCVSPNRNFVNCEIEGIGYNQTKEIQAGGLAVFDLDASEGQPFRHFLMTLTPKAKVYQQRGIHIKSENPIVVYVIIRFKFSSDGFLALPNNALGNEYIVSPYTASYWSGSPAWTLITAAYDNTEVKFTMGGDGISQIETSDSVLTFGKSVNFNLQKGDVYVLGTKSPLMEMSGSKITSNYPVAVTSGVLCANIPLDVNACDYNAEMELPTDTWGQNILIPVCENRKKPGIIRVFAKYPDTKIYKDGKFYKTIRTAGGKIEQGWYEDRATNQYDSNSIYPVIYSADKPFSIVYYNPGSNDDATSNESDPFQMNLTPLEQFQSDIMFAAINAAGGFIMKNNYMSIVCELDQNGNLPDDIELGTWNGNQWNYEKLNTLEGKERKFKNILIKDKRFTSKTINVPSSGVLRVRSLSGYKFACYSYGSDMNDSYGYPTSTAMAQIETQDFAKPIPKYTIDCDGSVGINTIADVTDIINSNASSKLADAYMFLDSSFSYNYRFKVSNIISGNTGKATWNLTPINPFSDSKAVIVFKDKAGNDTIISIENIATRITSASERKFGIFKQNSNSMNKEIILKNESKKNIKIKDIKLQKNNVGFKIEAVEWDKTKAFNIGDSILVKISFNPSLGSSNSSSVVDMIGIEDECSVKYILDVSATLQSTNPVNDSEALTTKIFDISPNPITNAGTKAKYVISNDSKIEINILNSNGQTLINLFKGFKNAGEFELEIPFLELSSGIYFIELKQFDKVIDKPFVIQK
ncbi:MAG: T9SS type A sorting domain-containing protein [Candidatus Kapabacteria bacterium]|nr:T9SS type A sorting domain-containing protein [Candidatus Kapabacteria bacterium]